jgi:hypothetical protein
MERPVNPEDPMFRSVLKWGGIAFVLLIPVSIVSGCGSEEDQANKKAVTAKTTPTATTPEAPQATPVPDVKLTVTSGSSITGESYRVHGRVKPINAKVKVNGEKASVKDGKFERTITLQRIGDNDVSVIAKAKGFTGASADLTVSRRRTQEEKDVLAAKKAQAREEKRQAIETENALATAESYLDSSGFSRSGLIEQLEFEGFSTEAATAAVDSLGVNWNKQAARTAESYMDSSSFSPSGLIEQLQFEGYTYEQAVAGARAVGY